ncbi:MAG TPA: NAD(P)-dependent oxidoreductase [Sphingomonas sp.]|nr:NAD(P)-dependent oxidoreductase [Sphingomonas sp.]
MKVVLPALARPLVEARMPHDLELCWFTSADEAAAMAVDADIAWADTQRSEDTADIIAQAARLKWLSTIRAGLDALPLDLLRERGTIVTNGMGLNAETVADYAVMGVLVAAKRFDEVVRLADRHQWTLDAPGRVELSGSRALVIGYGTIGRMIGDRLTAFGVEVVGATRSGRDRTLSPDQWRGRLGAFDWVVLAAPSTGETRAMIGADELAAMKPGAWLINIARGDMIDNAALIEAIEKRRIAGAFLDPTDPEPLPPDDPLWSAPNVIHSMHLAGRSQMSMFRRGAELFVRNLAAFREERPMENVVDLGAGY